MNDGVVVDASVAVKWVVDEEHTDRALTLLRDKAAEPILGPPHLASEVSNAIYQRLRRHHIDANEAAQALERFLETGVQPSSPNGLYQQAFEFGRVHALKNIYDSLYVVLAQMLRLELWTDDRTLVSMVGSAAPWVRWIGQYPLPRSG